MSGELEALVAKMRLAFQQEVRVAVMGWSEDDHAPFTSGISGKQVQFLPVSGTVPANAGLVLCLTSVGEKDLKRIRSAGKPLHKHLLRRGEVMRALNACKELFVRAQPGSVSRNHEPGTAAFPAASPQPIKEDRSMDAERKGAFTEAFRRQVNARGEVSAPVLAKICKQLGLGKSPELVKAGWVHPHKAEKRISCYTLAGEEAAPAVTDPTLSEMQRLLNEEPRLRTERAALDAEKAEFEARIAAQRTEFELAFRQKTEVLDRKLALIDGVKKNLTNIKHLLGED